jgi:uncharacterized protein YqkB
MAAMSDMQPILMKKSTVLGFAAEMTIDEGVREALHTLRRVSSSTRRTKNTLILDSLSNSL